MDQSLALTILKNLYIYEYETDEVSYANVDEFYGFLGYELELNHVLLSLNIQGTSDLQEKLASII